MSSLSTAFCGMMSSTYAPHGWVILTVLMITVFQEFGGQIILKIRHVNLKVIALLRRYALPLIILSCAGLMLWLAWYIQRSAGWRPVASRFIYENPVFVVILTIYLLILFFWLLLWKLPQWQVAAVPEMKDRIDLELKSRQTLAQILGGAALLIGLYFTSQTLRTTQEGQITDRFTKAIDQLGKAGKDNLAVRLGGIYALERIARDSASDHWTVMEVLTAFIREQAPAQTLPSDETSEERKTNESLHERKLPTDIQTILTVIGRRTQTSFRNGESSSLDLSRTKLERADLYKAYLSGVDLSGAYLFGAYLSGAYLSGAYLSRAYLSGVDLSGAYLFGVDLSGAYLFGAYLSGAYLREANLSGVDLSGAYLSGAYLFGANLQGAQNFTQDQINSACIDENSRLPEGLIRAAPCPTKP